MALEWKVDKAGDALWDGDTFIGCIYNRDSHGGHSKGWRVLDADIRKIIDITPDMVDQIANIRQYAREYLEGTLTPLPTAQQLLGDSRSPVQP